MSAVQALAVVLIRLWAVGYLTVWLFSVAGTVGMLASGVETMRGAAGYLTLASMTFILAFWIVVLCWSKRITLWVLPPVREADRKFALAPEEIVRIGTFLIGVYFLTKYVPETLQSTSRFVTQYMQSPDSFGAWWRWNGVFQFGAELIAILISLWLVFRPGHVAQLYQRLRRAGHARPEPAEDAPKAE